MSSPDDTDEYTAKISELLGPHYRVQDWKDLNRSLFSALKLEKEAMFLVLGIVILVASFSIVGNLIMVVVEKAREIALIKTLGGSDFSIMRLFAIQGLLIGLVGTGLGVATGLAACWVGKRVRNSAQSRRLLHRSHAGPCRNQFGPGDRGRRDRHQHRRRRSYPALLAARGSPGRWHASLAPVVCAERCRTSVHRTACAVSLATLGGGTKSPCCYRWPMRRSRYVPCTTLARDRSRKFWNRGLGWDLRRARAREQRATRQRDGPMDAWRRRPRTGRLVGERFGHLSIEGGGERYDGPYGDRGDPGRLRAVGRRCNIAIPLGNNFEVFGRGGAAANVAQLRRRRQHVGHVRQRLHRCSARASSTGSISASPAARSSSIISAPRLHSSTPICTTTRSRSMARPRCGRSV